MPCINQEPMYVEHLEQEIKEIIAGKLDYCFDSLKQSLEKRNYQVNIKNGDFSDISASTIFYATYHCFLAILARRLRRSTETMAS